MMILILNINRRLYKMEAICGLVNCKENDLVNNAFLIFKLTTVVGRRETSLGGGENGKQGAEQFEKNR